MNYKENEENMKSLNIQVSHQVQRKKKSNKKSDLLKLRIIH